MTEHDLAAPAAGQAELARRYDHALMHVFGAPQRVLVRGEGVYVWDADGNQYLDLLAGIAVNALGHAHPTLTAAVSAQMSTLGHISNFFTSPAQITLAERLLEISGAPQGSAVFFANSGTEANEAAFKMARRTGRPRILALEGAFHGRTMGALALTAKAAYREPFEPMPGGVEHLPFGDIDALDAAMADDVAALVIEVIQGEAGVRPLPSGYLAAARELTARHGALLIIDEVQTGIGRTGAWFAHTQPELGGPIQPDVVTLAKGLGGGFPIGAVIGYGPAASLLSAGQHGTTFGGNPIACAAGLATVHVIERDGMLAAVRGVGEAVRKHLAAIDGIAAVRGLGLHIGFDLAPIPGVDAPATVLAQAALDAGYIINACGPATIRLAPPLILTDTQAGTFTAALPKLIAQIKE